MNKEQIVYKKVSELKLNKKNPRKNDGAVDTVAKSIEKYGFKNPLIIDEDNVVWCGNTRLKASRKLGLKEVPCIVASDLTEELIREYALIDNKSSELSKWDKGLLELELDELDGLSIFDLDWGIKDKQDEEYTEVPFTEILGEQHNYIVLYFDNEVDWLQAETLFNLQKVKNLSTRKDGKISNGMKSYGIGRVIDGKKAINILTGVKNEN